MTAYVVASLIQSSRQHASFGVVHGVFDTAKEADTWREAAQGSRAYRNAGQMSVYPAPVAPALPPPADDVVIAAPCADATGVRQ